jgi:hypothetical protein
LLSTARRAASKEFERVPLQCKVGAGGNGVKHLWGQAGVYLHDAATLHTGEMVMVTPLGRRAADPIPMCAVAKLNAIQHALRDQRIYCAKDGGAADPTILLLQVMPQLIGRKVTSLVRQTRQPVRD